MRRASSEDPAHDADVNVLGGLTLLRACVDHGVRKVIYTSSGGAIYGDPENIPCTEDHPIRPLSPYGASKYALEVYLGVFQRTFGLDFTTLRYANIYGPRQNIAVLEGRVISTFASRMLAGQPLTIDGDGEQARDMLFVSDVVGANVAALSRGSALPYHIATGVPVTVNEIYDILRDLTEYTLPVQRGPARRGDVYKIALDPTRAARDLGWRPSVQLRDGLERIVRHLREDPTEASAHQ
jgi:UDP-glucose 4-epimerase